MKIVKILVLALIAGVAMGQDKCPEVLNVSLKPLQAGATVDFCKAYKGKVILAVNTASQCGYTGQFKGLENLFQTYKNQGFVVLGFPSNDFNQEFESAQDTQRIAQKDYGVSFPMFEKSGVSGSGVNPFFGALIKASGVPPSWNFQKYLIGRDGKVLKSYPSRVEPNDPLLQLEIEAALKMPEP